MSTVWWTNGKYLGIGTLSGSSMSPVSAGSTIKIQGNYIPTRLTPESTGILTLEPSLDSRFHSMLLDYIRANVEVDPKKALLWETKWERDLMKARKLLTGFGNAGAKEVKRYGV